MNGFTPLHWAARYGEIEIIKALCEYKFEDSLSGVDEGQVMGACEYMPDMNGFTPLDYAGKFE
jgi:ankyrin repeat protein